MNLELKITQKEIKIAVALSFFSVLVFLAVRSALLFEDQYEKDILLSQEKSIEIGQTKDNFLDKLSLSSKAYFVWDLKTGEKIGGLNEEMQFPLASLTKLMTILVAAELSLDGSEIAINASDLEIEGDNGLIEGEKWKISDLIDFMLLTSSNDGAHAVASVIGAFNDDSNNKDEREIFIEAMNKKVEKLGMSQSFFLNETGLDISETVSGGYGSAKDVAILIENILREYPNLLDISSYKQAEVSSNLLTHQVINTNPSVENLPSVIVSKTGYTDLAGGNLVVVFDVGIDHKIVVSVLGSTKEERFSDVEKLVWATLEKIFNDNQKL